MKFLVDAQFGQPILRRQLWEVPWIVTTNLSEGFRNS
jgi:hypothetical protein